MWYVFVWLNLTTFWAVVNCKKYHCFDIHFIPNYLNYNLVRENVTPLAKETTSTTGIKPSDSTTTEGNVIIIIFFEKNLVHIFWHNYNS